MVRVRPATAPDLPRLIEIARHSATAAQWSLAEYARLFAPGTQQKRTALVIEEGDEVAGFLVAQEVEQEWEIENIAVSGQARRRGLGTRLLGEFLNLVRSRGGDEVFLEVRESNLAARALYEKWAFVETGRRKMYYADPPEDAVVLRIAFSH